MCAWYIICNILDLRCATASTWINCVLFLQTLLASQNLLFGQWGPECNFCSAHIYSASANIQNKASDPIKSLLYLCFCSFSSHLTSVEFVFPRRTLSFLFSLAYVRAQAAMCRLEFYYVLTCWEEDSTNSAAKQIILESLAILSGIQTKNTIAKLYWGCSKLIQIRAKV